MTFLKKFDRQDRSQAPENIEVIPLNDVATRRGGDHASEVWRNASSHGRPPRSVLGQIAADERLYDFCRLVASLQRVALLAGAQGAWRRAARKCCYGPCCRKEREIEARKAATSQRSPLKRSLAL